MLNNPAAGRRQNFPLRTSSRYVLGLPCYFLFLFCFIAGGTIVTSLQCSFLSFTPCTDTVIFISCFLYCILCIHSSSCYEIKYIHIGILKLSCGESFESCNSIFALVRHLVHEVQQKQAPLFALLFWIIHVPNTVTIEGMTQIPPSRSCWRHITGQQTAPNLWSRQCFPSLHSYLLQQTSAAPHNNGPHEMRQFGYIRSSPNQA